MRKTSQRDETHTAICKSYIRFFNREKNWMRELPPVWGHLSDSQSLDFFCLIASSSPTLN